MKRRKWGNVDGKEIFLFELKAGSYKACISNYGATLTHLFAPDASGNVADIVLGFDDLQNYQTHGAYFGATVGRFGNRIHEGRFSINGKDYQTNINENGNTLHGGKAGFHQKIWDANHMPMDDGEALSLHYRSADQEEGFPGELDITVTYELHDDGRLIYDVRAASTKDTICSILNHAYFNLNGHGDIKQHYLWIDAQEYTEVDPKLIPTGNLLPVKGTALDFRTSRQIGDDTLDHNFCLQGGVQELRKVACLTNENASRRLNVWTTLPGLQIYNSASMASSNFSGKDGSIYPDFAGLCLETQFYPNSMNVAGFASPILRKGSLYHHQTIYHMKI